MQDNLITHKPALLYEVFPAVEARRLVERFEWHYTAESELNVLSRQCLDRRMPDKQTLIEEVSALQDRHRKMVQCPEGLWLHRSRRQLSAGLGGLNEG